jgi:DNA-binding transcriptional LysR family regulator
VGAGNLIDLIKLKTFLVVAATNSFTLAAARLGYSQSSVTTHIQILERELGVSLFDRMAKRVTLTEVGCQLAGYAQRLLDLAEEARDSIRKRENVPGPVRLSAPEAVISYCLPPAIMQFQWRRPGALLSVACRSDSKAQLAEVLDGAVDLAIVVGEQAHAASLTSLRLAEEEMLIVRSAGYRSLLWQLDWNEMALARMIIPERTSNFRPLLDRVLNKAGVALDNVIELGTLEAAKRCALSGMGLAVLPRMSILSELNERRLVPVRWPGPAPAPTIAIDVVRHREKWASPAVLAFWELLQEAFSYDRQLAGLELAGHTDSAAALL